MSISSWDGGKVVHDCFKLLTMLMPSIDMLMCCWNFTIAAYSLLCSRAPVSRLTPFFFHLTLSPLGSFAGSRSRTQRPILEGGLVGCCIYRSRVGRFKRVIYTMLIFFHRAHTSPQSAGAEGVKLRAKLASNERTLCCAYHVNGNIVSLLFHLFIEI